LTPLLTALAPGAKCSTAPPSGLLTSERGSLRVNYRSGKGDVRKTGRSCTGRAGRTDKLQRSPGIQELERSIGGERYYRLEFEKIGDVVNKRQWFAGVEEADGRRVSRNSSIEFPR
jgi:hypothetical protein